MRGSHGGSPESPPADPAGDYPDRAGLVVIRVWLENENTERLRARISLVPDLERGETAVAYASTLDEIVATVREFVAGFLDRPPPSR